jgi:hypothetical protein
MKLLHSKPFASLMLVVALVALALTAFSPAHAGTPYLVNATGTTTYGTSPAVVLGIERNTDSGNRTMVSYQSGTQYVTDDAAWSKYAKFVADCGAACVSVTGSNTGLTLNVSIGMVNCWASGSIISWPNAGPARQLLGDGCAYWTKVKASAN